MTDFVAGPVTTVQLDAGTGASTLVAGTTGKIIRVHALVCVAAAAGSVAFGDTDGGTITSFADLTAPGLVLPFNPYGWGDTQSGQGLTITLAEAVGDVDGIIQYSVLNG